MNNIQQIIFLDRDGVINVDSFNYIKNASEWYPIPGSLQAIATLCFHHFLPVIISNQSGIGRQLFSINDLHQIHDKMSTQIKKVGGFLHAIYYCPHHPDNNCSCRKPKPGLINQALQEQREHVHQIPYMIGDSLHDLQAAIESRCSPIFVKTGKTPNKTTRQVCQTLPDVPIFENLAHFVDELTDNLS